MTDYELLAEQCWNSCPCNVHHARVTAREISNRYLPDYAELIELAIGEACANAVEHGSPRGEMNCFYLRCAVDAQASALVFEVEDEGQEFALTNLTLNHTPDLESEGGRGLFIINQVMDDVKLLGTNHGLNIRMTKHF
jgi:anti-sigma regulatory factor (Ser/Thr protein kinase)